MLKSKQKMIITVTADIHIDGDVYIKNKKGVMIRVGCLGESDFKAVPDKYFLMVEKITK